MKEITASDLLHLPHIVISNRGIIGMKFMPIVKEFDNGEEAHKYAEKQTSENHVESIMVCALIRTISKP